MKTLTHILAVIFTVCTLRASIIEEGGGIVYGKDHVFSFKAPKGWVLDNENGVNQGLHAVFYPKDSSWKDSKVVAYTQSRPRKDKVLTAAEQAADTIKTFRE